MAPELVLLLQSGRGTYTEAVDVWALGVVAYNLLYARQPFPGRCAPLLRQRIRAGDFTFPRSPRWPVSDAAKDFVARLLTVDPARRPSAAAALAHPWLAGPDPAPRSPCSLSTTHNGVGAEGLTKTPAATP
eukprot:TRINITY_DN13816_c0_g1_i1.p4 TRINITY_DN13816_c0_g1~~TRINITY_DN13816_c0_g1_i1.p4  ORF type:complete len:131 (-),score=28.91 TRINITY_DN13816_c0_g1_i1:151-543(-)